MIISDLEFIESADNSEVQGGYKDYKKTPKKYYPKKYYPKKYEPKKYYPEAKAYKDKW